VNIGPQSAVIRSVGQIRTMDDIRNTMLTVRDGSPVLVSDVATISVGNQPRLGVAGMTRRRRGAGHRADAACGPDHADLARRGGGGRQDQQLRSAAAGVRIERIYDRSVLVDVTTRTVLHNMVMGVLLIFLIQWLFLGDLRSALIVSATIRSPCCSPW